jgi:hypothetical protein
MNRCARFRAQILQYAEEILNSQVRSHVFVALCDCKHLVLFRVEHVPASAIGALDLRISKSRKYPLASGDCSGLHVLHQFLNAELTALGFQSVNVPGYRVDKVG